MWKKHRINDEKRSAGESAFAVESLEARELFWSWGVTPTPTTETSQTSITLSSKALPMEQGSFGDGSVRMVRPSTVG